MAVLGWLLRGLAYGRPADGNASFQVDFEVVGLVDGDFRV
jgi:hypothetical protein